MEVFTTTSIYCVKYALWRRLHVPIQNLQLALTGRGDLDLPNFVEIRHFIDYQEPPPVDEVGRKPSLQEFLSRPMAPAFNLELALAIVSVQGQAFQGSSGQQLDQPKGNMMPPKQSVHSKLLNITADSAAGQGRQDDSLTKQRAVSASDPK